MKILLCHNYYRQPGGEDRSFELEGGLLESQGHDIVRYTLHNDAIGQMKRWDLVRRTFWNSPVYRELRELIAREKPAVMHCTNTFPLLSPSAYYAARAEGVPVVQSLRNFRLMCPGSLFLRNGRVCEDCCGKRFAWPGVLHKCYRKSRLASSVVAAMLAWHKRRGTWTHAVDRYFTLTNFCRQKFIEGGLPAEKIAVKPNFVSPDPGIGTGAGRGVVFVGRLSEEKGIHTLLQAWSQIPVDVPLRIVGDGPLRDVVRAAAADDARIAWLGQRSPGEVLEIIGEAACLVMPSLWYETFGRVIIEAFAKGTPVVVSRLGAMAELVSEGRNGLCVAPGDSDKLAGTLDRLLADQPRLAEMRRAARREYETKYTGDVNYRILMDIYRQAGAVGCPQVDEPTHPAALDSLGTSPLPVAASSRRAAVQPIAFEQHAACSESVAKNP